MIIRWFLSRTFRDAVNMKRHVRKVLRHQRDILTTQAVDALNGELAPCCQLGSVWRGRLPTIQSMNRQDGAATNFCHRICQLCRIVLEGKAQATKLTDREMRL